MGKKINYTAGQKIGECLFLGSERVEKATKKRGFIRFGLFKCRCGVDFESRIESVKFGLTKSCGCLQKEKVTQLKTVHGLKHSPEYNIWLHIKQRCTNPKSKSYSYYGGRGIKICEKWINSFQEFYNDMGPRPDSTHSIERINNNLGYNKLNCRWATKTEQARNTRATFYLTFQGQKKCVSEWADIFKMPAWLITQRIKRYGWSVEDAFLTQERKIGRRKILNHGTQK